MTIRARLANGELATYIGQDANAGYVVQTEPGVFHVVDTITPEFGNIATPTWITGIYQGPGPFGIGSWPTEDDMKRYVADQLRTYNRIIPIGQLVEHDGHYVLADSTGTPLKANRP